jgi:hypothetical protein
MITARGEAMRNPRTLQVLLSVVRRFQEVLGRARVLGVTPRLVPAAVPVGSRASGPRRVPSSRRIGSLVVLVGVALLAASAVCAAQSVLPARVPNIYDPGVLAQFRPVALATLCGNPDFPVILLANATGEQLLLLGFDARNGKDTWSMRDDPLILIAVFSGETTLEGVYVDSGFVDSARASGRYVAVDDVDSAALAGLLEAVAVEKTRISI